MNIEIPYDRLYQLALDKIDFIIKRRKILKDSAIEDERERRINKKWWQFWVPCTNQSDEKIWDYLRSKWSHSGIEYMYYSPYYTARYYGRDDFETCCNITNRYLAVKSELVPNQKILVSDEVLAMLKDVD